MRICTYRHGRARELFKRADKDFNFPNDCHRPRALRHCARKRTTYSRRRDAINFDDKLRAVRGREKERESARIDRKLDNSARESFFHRLYVCARASPFFRLSLSLSFFVRPRSREFDTFGVLNGGAFSKGVFFSHTHIGEIARALRIFRKQARFFFYLHCERGLRARARVIIIPSPR